MWKHKQLTCVESIIGMILEREPVLCDILDSRSRIRIYVICTRNEHCFTATWYVFTEQISPHMIESAFAHILAAIKPPERCMNMFHDEDMQFIASHLYIMRNNIEDIQIISCHRMNHVSIVLCIIISRYYKFHVLVEIWMRGLFECTCDNTYPIFIHKIMRAFSDGTLLLPIIP